MRFGHVTILHLLPAVALLAVAGFNLYLVHQEGLSIWRVGGFGMFSSLDNRSTRHIEAVAIDGKATRVLDLSGYEREVEHLRILPRGRDLENFLQEIACDQALLLATTDSVELTYYGLTFEGSTVAPVVRWRGNLSACKAP